MRWKGIVALFALITTFSFHYYVKNYHYFYRSAETAANDIQNAFYLWFVLLLFTLIFAVGINFADRKIKQKKFTKAAIIKFNLLVFVVVTVILEIILWSMSCQGEGCMVKFIGAPLIPAALFFAVIIFSVVPSFIISKLDNKMIKKILLVGLILSGLFVVLAIASLLTCDFNARLCLAEKALETGNPSFCEKSGSQQQIDLCYLALSDRYAGDENFCYNIKEERLFNVCIRDIATNRNDTSICNEINSTIAKIGRQECIDWVNVANNRKPLEGR